MRGPRFYMRVLPTESFRISRSERILPHGLERIHRPDLPCRAIPCPSDGAVLPQPFDKNFKTCKFIEMILFSP